MSIIVTQINKYGIVFGTDSNISNESPIVHEDKKIFQIPKLNSAMCTAGAYSIEVQPLNEWLPNFIKSKQKDYSNLGEFTKLLANTLKEKMTKEEKKSGGFITHIAGYNNNHPEMWHISNTTLVDDKYTEGTDEFHYSEDFWQRDWKKNNLEEAFESNGLNYQIYVNGFPPGRVAFNIVRNFIDSFFVCLWSREDNYKFRSPQSLDENKQLVKSYIELISTSFILSNYKPKYIGGETQICAISNR